MNKDEFIRMQQAATNRVREMQKKAMQNNEKHDKNISTQKNIQNNKKATKSEWSDGSSITYTDNTDNTNNTKYPIMPDFVTPISETKYKKDAVKSTKPSNNNTYNTKYISTSNSSYGSVFDSPITLNNTALSAKKDQAVCCNCPANKGVFSNLSGQNDRLLLLGIIILLMGDNVDELLILALIYVML